jgi:hypothetical protein
MKDKVTDFPVTEVDVTKNLTANEQEPTTEPEQEPTTEPEQEPTEPTSEAESPSEPPGHRVNENPTEAPPAATDAHSKAARGSAPQKQAKALTTAENKLLQFAIDANREVLQAASQKVIKEPAWIHLDDKAPVIEAGSIVCIQAKTGSHKSRLAATIAALLIADAPNAISRDFWKFGRCHAYGHCVVYVDTERSLQADFAAAVQSIRIQAGFGALEDTPRLYATSLKKAPRKLRFDILKLYLQHVREDMAARGIADYKLTCIVDVCTDLVSSFNDEKESLEFMDYIGGLCENEKICFVGVIHENPMGDKARGHLGTQLMNGSNVILKMQREKDQGKEFVKLMMLKNRNAKPTDEIFLEWSESAHNLITAADIEKPVFSKAVKETFLAIAGEAMKRGEVFQIALNDFKNDLASEAALEASTIRKNLPAVLRDKGFEIETENGILYKVKQEISGRGGKKHLILYPAEGATSADVAPPCSPFDDDDNTDKGSKGETQ